MKSRIWCTFVIAMLLISTVAFGEIICEEDWWGDEYGLGGVSGNSGETFAYGAADGDNNWGWGIGEGWQSYYNTRSYWGCWEYEIYTSAEGHLWLWDGLYCYAYAVSEASAQCKYDSDSLEAEVFVEGSGTGGEHLEDSDNGGVTKSGCGFFYLNESVDAEHLSCAVAGVGEGGENSSFCFSYAEAKCSLVEKAP